MKRFLFFLVASAVLSSSAGPRLLREWTFEKSNAAVAIRNGGRLFFDPLRDSSGNPVLEIEIPKKTAKYPVVLTFRSETPLKKGRKIEIEFEVRSSLPCRAELQAADAAPPYSHRARSQTFDIPASWKKHRLSFVITSEAREALSLPQILFREVPPGARIDFGPIRVSDVTDALPRPAFYETRAGREWRPVDTSDLVVKAGSALDLSGLVDRSPAGTWGRVTVDAAGRLVFEKRPERELRFFSIQLLPGSTIGMQYMSHAEVEALVETIVRQGYNMVRIHGPGRFLVGPGRGAALKNQDTFPLPETADEIEFDPVAQDRLDYFIYLLKKNGIYINLDGLVSFVGFSSEVGLSIAARHSNSAKVQMFVNPARRRNWTAGVSKILTHRNPYTGTALKDDPVLALLQYYNEQDIRLDLRDYSDAFQPLWSEFLQRKYRSYSSLYAAWQGRCGDVALPPDGSFSQVPGISFKVARTNTPAGIDMTRFQAERELEMTRFYQREMARIGYRGLTTQWDMATRLVHLPARAEMPVITMHGYHAHPSGYGGSRGITLNQKSPLAEGGSAVKRQSTARWLDRPYLITEFGFVFWNRYRHEQGLVYGACASLQNWNGIACHCNQAVLYGDALVSFQVGHDPVGRASELVTAFCYLRGDVRPSPHTVEIPISEEFAFGGRAMGAIPDELSRMWIWSRIGLTFAGRYRAPVNADLRITPDGTAQTGGSDMFEEIRATRGTAGLERYCALLKRDGILPGNNRSNPARGLYESDTGEIFMNVKTAELSLQTVRLEGAVLKSDHPVTLDALTVERCTVPAAVTVVSLDRRSIRNADRLLAVIATDARNSNMRFSDKEETTLESIGTLPVLVKTGRFRLAIARPDQAEFHAYALKLNGERASELPVSRRNGRLILEIDSGASPEEPALFYELVRK